MKDKKATHNDIDELIRIRLEYISYNREPLKEEQLTQIRNQLEDYFKVHLGKDLIAYIAEEDGIIVSSVFLVIIEKPANLGFPTGKIGEILNVYTRSKYRKKGIASKLLRNAIEESKKMNLSYLELKATEEGYPVYKKLGFVENTAYTTPMKYLYPIN